MAQPAEGGHHSHAEIGTIGGQIEAHRAEVREELARQDAYMRGELAALRGQQQAEDQAAELAAAQAAAEEAAAAALAAELAAAAPVVVEVEEVPAEEGALAEEEGGGLEPPVVEAKPKPKPDAASRDMWARYPA